MKVFISWSGEQSKKLAEAIKDWLPSVLQVVVPYFTPSDIDKGSRWSSDIANELSQCQIGLFCLTSDNLHSDWILFEAGALSKNLTKSHVCPILFGILNTDLEGPLKQFQTTQFSRVEFLKLITVINEQCAEHKLNSKVLDTSFNKWWPDLETKLTLILNEVDAPIEPVREQRDILEEILSLARQSSKINSRGNIPTGAIKDILRTVIDIHEGQKYGRDGYQTTLNTLFGMRKAVEFISNKYRGQSDEVDNLIQEFNDLTYETIEAQDENEIPF